MAEGHETVDDSAATIDGGHFNSTPPTLTDQQYSDLQVDSRGNLRVALYDTSNNLGNVAASDADGKGTATLVPFFARQQALNGLSWDRVRTPNVFKTVNLSVTAGTPAAVWTPAAGKKFRLMGFVLALSTTAVIKLIDNVTEILRMQNLANQTTVSPPMGNGFLSAAANNVLNVDVGTSGTVSGYVFGTEE